MRFIIIKHEISERLTDYKEKIDTEIVALENKGYEVIDIDFSNPYSIIKYKNNNDIILKTKNGDYKEIHSKNDKVMSELKQQLSAAEQNAEDYKNRYDIMVKIANECKNDANYYKDHALKIQKQYELEQREKSKYINENNKLQEKLNKNKREWRFL